MNYTRLFRLELRHEYHANGFCTDFDLEPTAAAAKRLKQQRMRLRSFGYGVEVLAETTATQELFIELGSGIELEFLLKLRNPAFVQYTQLPTLTALTTEERQEGKQKWHAYSSATLGANDRDMPHAELTASRTEVPQYSGAWAVAQVALNSNITNNIGTPPTYTITFAARSETWRYYLLTEPTAADYQVVDGLAEVSFAKTDMNVEPSPDTVSQRLIDRYPDATTYRFESSAPVAYSQLGRKHLNLRKDGALVIEHLPVPANGQGGVHIVKTFV